MGGSKILSTLSDIFSSVDVEDDYQGSVLGEKRTSRQKGKKRNPASIMGSENSDVVSTINEEDFHAKHVAELKRKDKARKKKPNKLMATLNDLFGSHAIDQQKAERQRAEKRRGQSRRDVKRIDLSQYEEPASLLAKERERVRRAESQIQTLVAMNRDLQEQAVLLQEESNQDVNRNVLNLKLRFNREEKSRLEAERREYLVLKELEGLRAALAASQQRRQQAEDELEEAASDILDTRTLHSTCQDLQKSCQGAMKQERDAWLLADKLKKEVEVLERRLKRSEQERSALVEEVARLKVESQHWEKALDTLQDQVDSVLGHGSLENPALKSGGRENGIAEVATIGEHDDLPSGNNSPDDHNKWRSDITSRH